MQSIQTSQSSFTESTPTVPITLVTSKQSSVTTSEVDDYSIEDSMTVKVVGQQFGRGKRYVHWTSFGER